MWDCHHEIEIAGTACHVRERCGQGSVLVLLHGLGWTGEIWTSALRHLPDSRILAPDLPGHGQSGATADFAFDTLSDALAALADRSRAPSLHVVGSSWGAALALRLAARHPSRVERVTLLDGGFYAVQDYPDLTWEAFANGGAPPDHACESLRTYLDFMRSDAPDFWNQDIEAAVIDQVRTEKPGGRVRPCRSPANRLPRLSAACVPVG